MEKEIKIYHVETQEDYDDLMIKLENEGCMWSSGDKPTDLKLWYEFEAETVIYLGSWRKGELTRGDLSEAKSNYPTIPIIKHKAKGVEQMKKVVVPQFVADWFKEVKGDKRTLYNTLSALKHSENVEVCDWYKGDDTLDIYENFYKKQQIIAKMHLYGYEVEEEKKYYWRKKKEYTFDLDPSIYINVTKYGRVFFSDETVDDVEFKTKFTEAEIKKLVSEEDFDKLEKVEIEDV